MTAEAEIRDLTATDLAWMAPLNQTHKVEMSDMSPEEWAEVFDKAPYIRGYADGAGFLIAMDPRDAYDSPNLDWLRPRYEDFLYIDRIAIDPAHRGQGLARRLYDDLIGWTVRQGYRRIACEVNLDPPNPPSDAFHDALGFIPVGQMHQPDRGKTVRFRVRELR